MSKTILGIAGGALAGILLTVALVSDAATKTVTITLPAGLGTSARDGFTCNYSATARSGADGGSVPGVVCTMSLSALDPAGKPYRETTCSLTYAVNDARISALGAELALECSKAF